MNRCLFFFFFPKNLGKADPEHISVLVFILQWGNRTQTKQGPVLLVLVPKKQACKKGR